MDLIRAYACGLLPDNCMQDPDEIGEVKLEAQHNILGFTDFRFKTLMEQSFKTVSYMTSNGDWDSIGIISMQRLCEHLLRIYVQQQEKIRDL